MFSAAAHYTFSVFPAETYCELKQGGYDRDAFRVVNDLVRNRWSGVAMTSFKTAADLSIRLLISDSSLSAAQVKLLQIRAMAVRVKRYFVAFMSASSVAVPNPSTGILLFLTL